MDYNFEQIVKWLLYGLVDFDFISESLLPELQSMEDINSSSSGFKAGVMSYDVIVVPNCVTLRRTTLERLKAFVAKGGKIVFTGIVPSYIDAVISEECKVLLNQSTKIGFNKMIYFPTFLYTEVSMFIMKKAREPIIYSIR